MQNLDAPVLAYLALVVLDDPAQDEDHLFASIGDLLIAYDAATEEGVCAL